MRPPGQPRASFLGLSACIYIHGLASCLRHDMIRLVASEKPTRLIRGSNKARLAVQVALVSFESLLKISTFFEVSLSSTSLLWDHAASTGHCEEVVLPASDMVPAIRSPEISHST